ncbi:rhamnogalacturonan acetylesterase [Microbacterium sp. C7(2022)]|uniref:rhamnogalacturonan acetylesterase n=1 Tax=Microbacterium sp. C7(2022) TaxID=2992759 RepID=UPI00237ABB47|nr:rhamnogalacturonan acetylesterase [Microbacterium sp. C7(2022)]MDE0546651.1 rhamnogalacturonan acetylesterase [Microbacterium sp. C7(2022)]
MTGWGSFIEQVVEAPVRNLAFGGATTQSFIDAGSWQAVLDGVAADDVVLIQFGHNDQKDPALDSRGGYSDRLRGFVADVRARGAQPVLCTSTERRWFEGDRVTPTHGDYPNAVRDLAREVDVPLIDLTAFTTWMYEDAGPVASKDLLCHFAPGENAHWPEGLADDTHFHERGARRIAAYVGWMLRGIERRDGDLPARGSQLVS